MHTKWIWILATLLSGAAAQAGTLSLKLTNPKMGLGYIANGQKRLGQHIRVTRTAATAKVVELSFTYDKTSDVCVETGYREVYVEGGWEEVCERDINGEPYCRDTYVPGHYETESYCAAYDDVQNRKSAKFSLDFKKARVLGPNESEVFNVWVGQMHSAYDSTMSFDAKVISSKSKYKIEQNIGALVFPKGLKFTAQ